MARVQRRREAPDHPRRRRPRLRAPGLPQRARQRHRRRGRRRLRARLPLLRLQGRGARHAVPRALERPARRRSARSTRSDGEPREKLYAVTSFIVDSYRHDPDLMKVIIVEVTRAANSFGRKHLDKIREAFDLIADIVDEAPAGREVPRPTSTPAVRRDGVLRRDRAGAHRLDLRRPARGRGGVRAGQDARRRDRSAAASRRPPRRRSDWIPPLDGQRPRQAPRLVRPARRLRRRGHHDHRARSPPWFTGASSGRIRPSERGRPRRTPSATAEQTASPSGRAAPMPDGGDPCHRAARGPRRRRVRRRLPRSP